jgi:hypothetical protein
MKRRFQLAGTIVAVLTICFVALTAVSFASMKTKTFPFEKKNVKALRLDLSSGGLVLRGDPTLGSDGVVKGSIQTTSGLIEAKHSETLLPDGTLVLKSRCSNFGIANCDVKYTLNVSKNMPIEGSVDDDVAIKNTKGAITINSSAGSLSVEDVVGSIKLSSSAEAVRVRNIVGDVTLESSADDVVATDIRSASVVAESSAGSVNISLINEPRNVVAKSSAGRVRVYLPRSSAVYAVSASSSAGSSKVDVKTDPDSPLRITVESSADDVLVGYSTPKAESPEVGSGQVTPRRLARSEFIRKTEAPQ